MCSVNVRRVWLLYKSGIEIVLLRRLKDKHLKRNPSVSMSLTCSGFMVLPMTSPNRKKDKQKKERNKITDFLDDLVNLI